MLPSRSLRDLCGRRQLCIVLVWVLGTTCAAVALASWLAPVRRYETHPSIAKSACWGSSGPAADGWEDTVVPSRDPRGVPPVAFLTSFGSVHEAHRLPTSTAIRRGNAVRSWKSVHQNSEVFVFGGENARHFAETEGVVRSSAAGIESERAHDTVPSDVCGRGGYRAAWGAFAT